MKAVTTVRPRPWSYSFQMRAIGSYRNTPAGTGGYTVYASGLFQFSVSGPVPVTVNGALLISMYTNKQACAKFATFKHYLYITCPPIKSLMADDRSKDLKSRPMPRLVTTVKG